ncbi:Abi family protein [Herbiconiux liukaitaii]|uniref:Abi family protein n=1 Tax=Herbiconiux liukaitaii TaxID=3342799 RepID=UPI0035BA9F47
MVEQDALETLLSPARMAAYRAAAGGRSDRAADLYLWATELAGAFHAQISFVELAVRNALDPQLGAWNANRGGRREWTDPGAAEGELYHLLGRDIREARRRAERESAIRARHHPRQGHPVNHDDLVAQLMFGSWVKLLRPMSNAESSVRQQSLWREGLHLAFPGSDSGESGRIAVGSQLDTLRYLRNRVAHHDNLLTVAVSNRLEAILSVLSKIDASYPAIVMARSALRRLAREDPRKAWT